MSTISIPKIEQLSELTNVARQTFVESHGHSAPKKDIENYLTKNYTEESIKKDIEDPNNTYRLIYEKNELAGFSKIVYNQPITQIKELNITKLERIYVLEKFHGNGLGMKLFNHNIELAKSNQQLGIWLYTWTENKRAVNFYKKIGFQIIGSHDFKISANHSNPNYLMWYQF